MPARELPSRTPSEFDSGIAERKATTFRSPGGAERLHPRRGFVSLLAERGAALRCLRQECPKECIDLDQKDEVIEVTVGTIIIATGYDIYDATKIERYGYASCPMCLPRWSSNV